jgi:N-acetylmuramoyl-L-alanine amidase
MRKIKHIVIHCSAGFGNRQSIERFWKESLGWKSPGYHLLIDLDGTIHELQPFNLPTNGVKGFNATSIHICYIGGVLRENVKVAADTRTDAQEKALIYCIHLAQRWIELYQPLAGVKILGHRDFSPDKNGNGVVDSWERIKECPSFDAIIEYNHLMK